MSVGHHHKRHNPPFSPSLTGLVHSRLECAGECAMPSKIPPIPPLFKADAVNFAGSASDSRLISTASAKCWHELSRENIRRRRASV
jgi:hypothetical protein